MTTHTIIDRRNTAKKRSSSNKQRFLRRIRSVIRNKATDIIGKNVGDMATDKSININKDTVEEPRFIYDEIVFHGHIVLPGNYKYIRGDEFELLKDRSERGMGSGQDPGKGDGEDDFIVEVSREEFLDYFFEDLELPNLEEKQQAQIVEMLPLHAGFTNVGPPNRLSIVRSMSQSKQRRIALKGKWKKLIKACEEEIAKIKANENMSEEDLNTVLELEKKITGYAKKIKSVPFLDSIDLRYRVNDFKPKRKSNAVIFFIMDNSGSMGEREKTISRKFFTLFYVFVNRKYENPDIIYISHTDTAKEVDEKTFFTTRDSGGTEVSSALKLAKEIIVKRYNPAETNIYICQTSDGDNHINDNAECVRLVKEELSPRVQYFTYLEIRNNKYISIIAGNHPLWDAYKLVNNEIDNFDLECIDDESQIYDTFRKFFYAGD